MMLKRYDDAVFKIHKAALEPAHWCDALSAIADITGSAGAVMRVLSLSPKHRTYAHLGKITIDQVAGYDAACGPVCPRQAYARAHPGPTIRCDALILSEREMDCDPVYEWFRRNGLRYFLGTTLAKTADREVFLNVQRTPRQGHVQRQEMEQFQRFLPHLRHAIRVGGLVGEHDPTRQLTQSLLDRLAHAAVLLDATGLVLFLNAAAEAMASSNDAMTISADRLVTRCGEEQKLLDGAVVRASATGTGEGFRLTRASGLSPYLTLVQPMALGQALSHSAAAVLVLLVDPVSPTAPTAGLLGALFGLTPTEAKVAALIATAAPTENVAARLGISVATVRVHLKNIYRKSGVSSRAELIAIFAQVI